MTSHLAAGGPEALDDVALGHRAGAAVPRRGAALEALEPRDAGQVAAVAQGLAPDHLACSGTHACFFLNREGGGRGKGRRGCQYLQLSQPPCQPPVLKYKPGRPPRNSGPLTLTHLAGRRAALVP